MRSSDAAQGEPKILSREPHFPINFRWAKLPAPLGKVWLYNLLEPRYSSCLAPCSWPTQTTAHSFFAPNHHPSLPAFLQLMTERHM